jgi:competence protein ComFC
MDQMRENLAYKAYQLIWEALDWLYPPNCGGCGQPGTRWCKECSKSSPEITPPICPICGNPNENEQPCRRCQVSRPLYKSLRSHTVYAGSIRQAIHRLKYRRDVGLGVTLARPKITSLKKLNWSLDIITSVPLGLVRFEERGYNQATLLAKPIALCLIVPFSSRVLTRTRETRTQVGLTVTERQNNMAGAFKAKSELVQGKRILVVDDVATSGATLNACANALLDQGALEVYGFSLARAVFSPGGDVDLS